MCRHSSVFLTEYVEFLVFRSHVSAKIPPRFAEESLPNFCFDFKTGK